MQELKKSSLFIKKEYGQCGLTAIFAAGLFSILYVIKGMYPFGSGSIMMTDMYSQYVPLLYRFYDVVSGQKNLFVDFRLSGGANMYVDTINEVLNPFNYVLFLFGRDMIYKAVNVVLLCYVTAAAVSANYFLLKMWPQNRSWNVILSLCYGLSGYAAYNFQIIKWMYLPVLFPLFALAFYRLLEKKKGGCFAVLLAYQLVLSIQMGFMALLFVLFSSAFYLFICVKKEERAERIWRLGLYTLAGILLACPVLVPNVSILLDSSRAGENSSYFGVMKQHGLDDLFERIFQIGHPVLLGIEVWLFGSGLKARRKSEADTKFDGRQSVKRFLLCLNGFLWMTVVLQPANLLWHMGSYVCFPVRYAYMVLLCEIALLKLLLTEKEILDEQKISDGKCRSAVSAAVVFAACSAAVVITLIWEESLVQAFSSLAISLVCRTETIVCCIILGLFALAAAAAAASGKHAKKLAVATVLICGLCLNLSIMLYPEYGVRQENEAAYDLMTQQAKKMPDAMEREKDEGGLPLNAALVNGQSTLTGYMPTANKLFKSSMEKLGYLVPWVATHWVGGTAVSDNVLSMEMLLDRSTDELVLTADTALGRQEELSELIFGEKMLESVSLTESAGEDAENVDLMSEGCRLMVEGKKTLYLDSGFTANNIRIWMNGEEVQLPESAAAYSPNRIFELGTFENEEVMISVTDTAGAPVSMANMELGVLDCSAWETYPEAAASAGSKILTKDQVTIQESAGKIFVELSDAEQNRTVYLPFAAIDGWKCERNGENVEILPVLTGFMGITAADGENILEITFIPPGLPVGIVLMLLGAALLAIGMVSEHTGMPGSVQSSLAAVYRIILAIAVLAVYVVPAIGLAVFMAVKVIRVVL